MAGTRSPAPLRRHLRGPTMLLRSFQVSALSDGFVTSCFRFSDAETVQGAAYLYMYRPPACMRQQPITLRASWQIRFALLNGSLVRDDQSRVADLVSLLLVPEPAETTYTYAPKRNFISVSQTLACGLGGALWWVHDARYSFFGIMFVCLLKRSPRCANVTGKRAATSTRKRVS